MFSVTAYQKSLKLNESGLLPPEAACSFCGSHERKPVFTLQTQPDVFLLKCKNCHVCSASRMPTDHVLSDYYNNYYTSEIFQKTGERVTSDDSYRQSRLLAKKINKYMNRNTLRILDFGGGDGSISVKMALDLLNNNVRQIEILVVDLDKINMESPDPRITITGRRNLDEPVGEFDIVLASAILEHLPNPHETIRKLLQCLKVNGIFYARTPSVFPVIKLFSFFGLKFDFTFPGHLHDMGQIFWEKYLSKCLPDGPKFKILESKPSIAETTFRNYFFRSLVSNALKLPWYILGNHYQMVGGWTIIMTRIK